MGKILLSSPKNLTDRDPFILLLIVSVTRPPGKKRPGVETDHYPPSRADVEND
jgi:hypothetical protein